MDQGGEAGREDDASELPPAPAQPGAAVAQRDRVQPRESREAGRRLALPRRIDGWSLTSWTLQLEADECTFPVERKLKTEILVKAFPTYRWDSRIGRV